MNWLRNFMSGRYGADELNFSIMVIALLISILLKITNIPIISMIPAVLLIIYLYRVFSKDIWKRKNENTKFLEATKPLQKWFKKKQYQFKDRTKNKYYKCPSCRQKIRVPRGKGKIQISCPKCRTEFIKKT